MSDFETARFRTRRRKIRESAIPIRVSANKNISRQNEQAIFRYE